MVPALLQVGEGGLDGPRLRERRAEMADEWWDLDPGEPGGELLSRIDVGLDGVARGMMSLGSGWPAKSPRRDVAGGAPVDVEF